MPEKKKKIPAVVQPPTLTGAPIFGSLLTVVPGTWSGTPTLAFAWLRDGVAIPKATGTSYRLVDDDDRHKLQCRVVATNPSGSATAVTAAVGVVRMAPVARHAEVDEIFDQSEVLQTFEASSLFEGAGLTYSVSRDWAQIDPLSGVVAVPTAVAHDGWEILITATNSGGSATVLVRVTVEGEESNADEAEARLGFAGAAVLQVVVHEGALTEFARQPASGEKVYDHDLDPTLYMGGAGTLDGVGGAFSGERSLAVPQLFTRFPSYAPTGWTSVFSVLDAATNRCPADEPGNWEVRVNGLPRGIAEVYRKTVPSRTRVTSAGEKRQSSRRHVLSLVLGSPLSQGDAISVLPPAGAPVLGQTYGAATVSEAIHVCHLGYPVAGPKKAYVGLWLGHSRRQTSGNTDTILSEATTWKLVREADGAVVASGRLSLAKAGSTKHNQWLDIPNYNGCDVYQADFSAHATVGTYRLEVAGVGSSAPFAIAEEPYAEAFRMAARAYFLQRSGCPISAGHGEGIERPRNGHPADGLTVWQSSVKCGRDSEGFNSSGTSPYPMLNSTTAGSTAAVELVPADWGANVTRWHESPLPAGWALDTGQLICTTEQWTGINLILRESVIANAEHLVTVECTLPGGHMEVTFNGGGNNPPPFTLSDGVNTFALTPQQFPAPWLSIQGQAKGFVVRYISVARPGATAGTPVPNAWGGWHDAADWDRRPRHADAIYVMADIIEKLPSLRLIDLNLPESGKAFAHSDVHARKSETDLGDGRTVLPDLIHEALWGISLWRRTQRGDGAILGGVEYSREQVEGSVSWNPITKAYAYDYEEWAGYKFAMAAAKLGHVIATLCGDKVLGAALVGEAIDAWKWAESVFATGLDAANGSGGDPHTVNAAILLARMEAAPVVYRASGLASAKLVFDSYNSFSSQSGTGLADAGQSFPEHGFWYPYHYTLQSIDYWKAGSEGRPVVQAISTAIFSWASQIFDTDWGTRLGIDYGLHSTDMYPWGDAWYAFGPGSGWKAARWSCQIGVGQAPSPDLTRAAAENLWFGLGCNPSNACFVPGLGQRQFSQPLYIDFEIPGMPVMGVAAGALRWWEVDYLGTNVYPKPIDAWPKYTQIFESHAVIKCAEFDIAANAMQWLYATALGAALT